MNQERIELSKFYEQRAANQHDRNVFDRGFYQGMQHERQGRMDAYQLGVVHTTLLLIGVMVAAAVVRSF